MSSQNSNHTSGFGSDILIKLKSIHAQFISHLLSSPDTVKEREVVYCNLAISSKKDKIFVIILTKSKKLTSQFDPNIRSYHITYSITRDDNPIHIKTERCAPSKSDLPNLQYRQIKFIDSIVMGKHEMSLNKAYNGEVIVSEMNNRPQLQIESKLLDERNEELINLANKYILFMNNSANNWTDESKRSTVPTYDYSPQVSENVMKTFIENKFLDKMKKIIVNNDMANIEKGSDLYIYYNVPLLKGEVYNYLIEKNKISTTDRLKVDANIQAKKHAELAKTDEQKKTDEQEEKKRLEERRKSENELRDKKINAYKAEAEAKAKAHAEAEAHAEAKAHAEAEAHTEAEAQVKAKAKAESQVNTLNLKLQIYISVLNRKNSQLQEELKKNPKNNSIIDKLKEYINTTKESMHTLEQKIKELQQSQPHDRRDRSRSPRKDMKEKYLKYKKKYLKLKMQIKTGQAIFY